MITYQELIEMHDEALRLAKVAQRAHDKEAAYEAIGRIKALKHLIRLYRVRAGMDKGWRLTPKAMDLLNETRGGK